jgi:integrase
MAGIKQSGERRKVPHHVTQEEVAALLERCPPHLYEIAAVAASTGLRESEPLNPQWGDIDLRQRTITVRNTAQGHTRNHEPSVVPMNDTVYEVPSVAFGK